MGEFIGDPRQRFNQNTSYPDLEALRNAYFEKYTGNYNIFEYVNLIKYFDNSLFKMIKDFTPARASLASGIVIKQTLLERNKYPQPEVTQSLNDYSGSINTAFISGGAGGSVNNLNGLDTNPYYIANGLSNVYGVTQSWQETFIIPSGVVTQTHDSQDEFYNGEFSGSEFIVEDGELNTECDPYKRVNPEIIDYNISHTTNNDEGQFFFPQQQVNLGIFLSDNIFSGVPVASGEIWTWWNSTRTSVRSGGSVTYYDTYKVKYIKIAKTSGNGVNLEDYIPNIDKLIIPSIIIDESIVSTTGWGSGAYISLTDNSKNYIELDILNISEKDTYYLLLVLQSDGYEFTITSQGTGFNNDSTPAPITIVADPNTQIVLEPFVPIGFYNSSCNPLINNSELNRLSEWYQQVDYATDQNIPVNFQQIISGTAYPAAVQDSNYTSYQYSGIRYWGSKNTTDNFNSPLTITSSIVQTYQNDNLGLTTLGYPSVNRLDATILQFDWGGGTYPQIINGGVLALNDMLLVGADKDAVSIYPPQQNGFLTASAQAYPIGSYPIFNQYSTTVTTTAGAEVAEYGWTTPSVSNYYIPSGSFGGAYGAAMITSSNPNELYIIDVEIFGLNPPGLGSINSQGFEVPVEATGSLNTFKTISSSLAEGGEWYVSMYLNLGNVASGTLQPITGSSKLSQKGVYEITSINTGSGGSAILTASLNSSVNTSKSASVFGNNSFTPSGTVQFAGFLIWQSLPGNYMRVENAT